MSKLGAIGIVILLLLGLVIATCSVTTVNSGHVGIKVANWGSETGVADKPLGVGWHYTAPGVDIYEYPIYTQTYAWTRHKESDGSGGEVTAGPNEEFDFQDKSGLSMSADISVAYHVNPALAPKMFKTYRQEMPAIVAGPLRNKIRSMLNENSSQMSVEEIMGPKKTYLIDKTLKDVRSYFSAQGLEIDQLYWASSIRLPANEAIRSMPRLRMSKQHWPHRPT